MNFWQFLQSNWSELPTLVRQHVALVVGIARQEQDFQLRFELGLLGLELGIVDSSQRLHHLRGRLADLAQGLALPVGESVEVGVDPRVFRPALEARLRQDLAWLGLPAKPWVPVKDGLRNAAGAPVHGGVLSALVDMAIGGALHSLLGPESGGTPSTLASNIAALVCAACFARDDFLVPMVLNPGKKVILTDAEPPAATRLIAATKSARS